MIRRCRMDCSNAIKLLVVLTFVHAISGQTASVSGPSRAAVGTNTSLTCTVNGGSTDRIQWQEVTADGATTFFLGTTSLVDTPKYNNFDVTSLSPTESVMMIENAEVEDDGDYRCIIPTDTAGDDINLVVEAPSNVTVTLNDTVINNGDMYVATCYAIGGKPQETLTWTLDGVPQTDGNGNTIVETNPPATAPLSNTESVFTFPATLVNNGQTLVCQVSGHDVPELNVPTSRDLDIHESADGFTMTVMVDYETQGTSITVSCTTPNQPRPAMRNFYIFSNGSQIHESMEGVNTVSVSDPMDGTQYTCMAGNYLGNTSLSAAEPYDPSRPTIPPTTAQEKTTPVVKDTTPGGTPGPSPGPIIGGVVAAIVVIVIIVIAVLYCKKQRCCCPCFMEAGIKSSGSSKPAGSAVGSSNGSEREKTKPEAAPRGHGSIQHTNDNPNQDMYAMVDKKPSGGRGGDAPDRGSGPGQNEPQGMLYADLDLSHKAGHTDKHVPKNENDVVVYSSILV